jgi:hypothetical protein
VRTNAAAGSWQASEADLADLETATGVAH